MSQHESSCDETRGRRPMAGAMRRMGVYLGLVEDDDTRGGYDRYAARQSDYDGEFDRADRGYDREYDRYAPEYDDEPAAADPVDRYGYGSGYGAGGSDAEPAVAEERAPEPEVSLGRRPATPRTLGLAGSTGSSAARLGGRSVGATRGAGARGPGGSRHSGGP